MKTYWNHTENERAELTEEQVRALLPCELMERGVLAPPPLALKEAAPVMLLTRRVFVLEEARDAYGRVNLGLAFDTLDQAEACRNAIGHIRETNWNERPKTRKPGAIHIVAEDLPTDAEVLANKAALEEVRRVAESNALATREYEAASKKASDATSSVWTDWAECRERAAHHKKIRETLREYIDMTDGNGVLAREFLAKVFPADEICAACDSVLPQAAP